ncbi:MAG: hypothetical protein QM578_02320 [Pantoea sp.]|uniref:hypothetical protein n=1 Tax=Pantoea sp. TaxID=69393 RepID=UPI0039E42BDF
MAYDNHYIVNWMEADKELALRLDRALKGVKDEMLEKGQQLSDAFTRATWYTSCLTDNYQDVCSRLGNEDVRFVKGLIELVKRRDIIFILIKLYVETYLKNESEDKVTNIARALSKMGAHTASGVLTSRALTFAVAQSIAHSFSLTSHFARNKIANGANYALWALTGYSYVTEAAKKAEELQRFQPAYYYVLYSQNLEMMYFLIEPIISRNNHFSTLGKTATELAQGLYRLMQ